MLLALMLLSIATADLVRLLPRRAWSLVLLLALWAGEVALVTTGTGLVVQFALVAPALALIWVATTPWIERSGSRPALGARMVPIALLLAGVVVAVVVDGRVDPPSGWLVSSIDDALPRALQFIPPTAVVLGIAIVLLLVETANRIVRATLPAPIAAREEQADAGGRRWFRRPPSTPPVPAGEQLKGGRLIGPLERILIAGLLLTGDYAIVAAIIAAKGIVRFPEISRGSGTGNAAEYFLVGSFVSWTIAFVAAGLLRLALQTPFDTGDLVFF